MMTEGGQNNEGGEGSALASINEVLEALDPENRESLRGAIAEALADGKTPDGIVKILEGGVEENPPTAQST